MNFEKLSTSELIERFEVVMAEHTGLMKEFYLTWGRGVEKTTLLVGW